MSISQNFTEIREAFNNSRKEQRIAFLEVLEDLLNSIISATKKPLITPESIYFKPIISNVSTQLVEEFQQIEPEVLAKLFEIVPTVPPGKEVSMVGIRKDKLRISEKLRDFYGVIGQKEADDIAINKKIFLSILEQYRFIEKQFSEDSPLMKIIDDFFEKTFCEKDEKGEIRIQRIEDITDPTFLNHYNLACKLFGEDSVKRAFQDDEEIEIEHYFIDTNSLVLLYKFLTEWDGIVDYISSFNPKTGEVTYRSKAIPFNRGDNPYLILNLLFEGDRDKGIDLEDTYLILGRMNRWNKRVDYDKGGKIQIENVIKGINRTFKKNFSNQKLIRISGLKAYIMV